MGVRRQARQAALQVLYWIDNEAVGADGVTQALDAFFEIFSHQAEVREYAETLVRGTLRGRAEIDDLIGRTSHHWKLDRMARVDRNVLRVASYELLMQPEVPRRVVLNEAVELGKTFGAEESGAFVNGVLDKIAAEVRRDE